ncbi:hypothetical protein SAMN05216178_6895 [Pseudomonas saponiphila]|jgi:hypothetical protein|uniref:Uncharacterized protein n=1 Tax=Pseudomonas saponiphila TaxID=556534 RepID=A0A1H4ZZH8_9PSED|nr:hypothetical protein [Pseudomonas saponiphila]SED35078.1 hypothetical protein SAMN05216178_6895 [Pseudomonas saponiphila]
MGDKRKSDALDRWDELAKAAVARAVQENKDLGLVPKERRTEWVDGVLCNIEGDKVTPVQPLKPRKKGGDEPATVVFKF